jgi:hypothetical protein
MTIADKFNHARRGHGGVALTSDEADAVGRAIEVLRRIRDNEFTNAQREAGDILRQIEE